MRLGGEIRGGIAVICLLAASVGSTPVSAADAGHQPFQGRADVGARYAGYEREAYYAPMPDGVRLAVTVYTPHDGPPAPEGFPVLLWYMPGHRESIDPKTGEIVSAFPDDDLAFFTSHGYALAAAEMRGSGASFGTRSLDRNPQIGKDGKALVDWIAAQPWSSGAVGMVGRSYQGFSQYATAAEQPAALKAIFPEIAGFDDYTSMFHPGGILVVALSEFATDSIVRDDQNHYDRSGRRPRLPSVPVIDEDGDGDLADEIPVDEDGDGAFLDDAPPTYADGERRDHVYYQATRDHLANGTLALETLAAAPYRDSNIGRSPYTYADMDPADRPRRIAEAGIAVYNRGGWFDYHARDATLWHATLSGHAPTRLMMAPTAHGGFPAGSGDEDYRAGPYFSYFGDTHTTRMHLNREKLRFFDHYLQGVDNGFDEEPPVLLYVMGEGWRTEQEWPPARAVPTTFHLTENGGLSREPGTEGVDPLVVDYATDSRWEGANRWNYRLAAAKSVMKGAEQPGRVHYQSEPLAQDMEVTGHPIVTLLLSSSAPDGDVFVYLEDVTPAGEALLVTEGRLRANYPRLRPIQSIVDYPKEDGPTVRPDLPWHGFTAEDYVERPFADQRQVTLTLDLMPTSWMFEAGHRIRVAVAGADSPTFARHPSLPADEPPTLRIHRGAASRIELPVIPHSP